MEIDLALSCGLGRGKQRLCKDWAALGQLSCVCVSSYNQAASVLQGKGKHKDALVSMVIDSFIGEGQNESTVSIVTISAMPTANDNSYHVG